MKLFNKNLGFSLVELTIIIIIIGILAVVAIPIYQANVNKLKSAEAAMILKSIKTMLQNYQAQHDAYPVSEKFVTILSLNEIDLNIEDLKGKYYRPDDFYYKSMAGQGYVIKAESARKPVIIMDSNGCLVSSK